MKKLSLLLFFILMAQAEASFMSRHCSNSSGSVSWEEGHNSNTFTFKYYDSSERSKVMPLRNVHVKFLTEVTIKEESVDQCGYSGRTHVYSGKVLLTPMVEGSRVLEFWSPDNQIETKVICTFHVNSIRPCIELEEIIL